MMTYDKIHLGECRSVKITNISEIGWHDTKLMLADIKAGTGSEGDQWEKRWHADNAAGSSGLIEITNLDGRQHNILLDCGWDNEYMESCYRKAGIDRMLVNGEIDHLFITHEHLDHLWGFQTVLRHRPDITVRVPATVSEKAMAFIRGEQAAPTSRTQGPLIRHTGQIIMTPAGVPTPILPGCVAVAFDLPILLGIRGEQSLYFRIHDRGTVCVTGCCHQTVTALSDYALTNIATEPTLYGLYGGLHLSPFGPVTEEQDRIIADMRRFGFKMIAANHCTGSAAISRMRELGYPIVDSHPWTDPCGVASVIFN